MKEVSYPAHIGRLSVRTVATPELVGRERWVNRRPLSRNP